MLEKILVRPQEVSKNHKYILTQPGGERLYFSDPVEFAKAKKAFKQSMINCGKPVAQGGFNSNSAEEVRQVYKDEI